MRPASRLRALLPALLPTILVVAWLLDGVHFAAVVHAVCPVDGTVAHGEHGHHGGDGHEDGPGQDGDDHPGDDHEHCPLVLLSRVATPDDDEVASLVRPAVPRGGADPPRAAPIDEAFPRYLLAPKGSPPSRPRPAATL